MGNGYGALNLRLAMAILGLLSAGFAVLLLRADLLMFGWLFIVLAVVAVVDLVILQLRRRVRRRAGGDGHSLFGWSSTSIAGQCAVGHPRPPCRGRDVNLSGRSASGANSVLMAHRPSGGCIHQ